MFIDTSRKLKNKSSTKTLISFLWYKIIIKYIKFENIRMILKIIIFKFSSSFFEKLIIILNSIGIQIKAINKEGVSVSIFIESLGIPYLTDISQLMYV
jgi:hypothetical protein